MEYKRKLRGRDPEEIRICTLVITELEVDSQFVAKIPLEQLQVLFLRKTEKGQKEVRV